MGNGLYLPEGAQASPTEIQILPPVDRVVVIRECDDVAEAAELASEFCDCLPPGVLFRSVGSLEAVPRDGGAPGAVVLDFLLTYSEARLMGHSPGSVSAITELEQLRQPADDGAA